MASASLASAGEARAWRRQRARVAGSLPPWAIFPLMLPFGLSGGYTTVVLVFLLSRAGVTATEIGAFLFVGLIPQTVKFLYAPLIDTTLGVRRWHAIGTLATAAAMVTLALVPATRADLGPLTAICFLSTFAATLVSTPADVIMAYDVVPERRGRAAGWATAANLGGGGIGGGVALWLTAQGWPVWLSPVVVALLCLACAPFVLLAAPRPPLVPGAGWRAEQRALLRDVAAMLSSRLGLLTILIAVLPIGTGAMQNLLPAIAGDWRAGAGEVALVSGGLSGVVQILGSLAGGAICDRFDRRWTYCAAGAAMALVSLAMAAGPRTPLAFVGLGLAYLFLMGIGYSAFTAAVLDAIGRGAAASKYTLIVCASNAAIFAQEALEGWTHDRFSLTGMLVLEAVAATLAIAIYAGAVFASGRFWRAGPGDALVPA